MNQKFSAFISVEETTADFNMSKSTVAEMERKMTTPVTARLKVHRTVGVVVSDVGCMGDRSEQATVFDGIVKFPMGRGSVDPYWPTSEFGDKPLNDGNGEKEGFRFPCIERCTSMVEVEETRVGWLVLFTV